MNVRALVHLLSLTVAKSTMYLIPGSLAISCSSNYCNKDGTFSAFVPIDDACDSNIILTANVCVHAWVCESLEAALGTVLCLDVKTLESF